MKTPWLFRMIVLILAWELDSLGRLSQLRWMLIYLFDGLRFNLILQIFTGKRSAEIIQRSLWQVELWAESHLLKDVRYCCSRQRSQLPPYGGRQRSSQSQWDENYYRWEG
jgi:hypothetical protein